MTDFYEPVTDFYEMRQKVAENIRRHRHRLGLSTYALGQMVTSNGGGNVSQWENCRCLPSAYSLCMLADIFECTVDELLGRTE